jgi:tetratricopeptide (TPR) repeat protein
MSNLKVLKGRWFLVLFIFATLPFSSPATPLSSYDLCATPLANADPDPLTNNEWRIYDVNGDGKFDVSDISEFSGNGGIDFINDLNRDGNKDLTDAFALYVKLSVLDRNCDEAVDDDDFTPVEPVELPEPDAAAVWPLVSRIVAEALKKLPPDIENQVFMSLPELGTMTFIEKANVYQETGMSALLQLNLEGAQWAYGRAYQTNNRSASALGSLAFTIAVDKRHEEALTLLAYARDLFRESGATSTTIGWIFARHGQNREALIYYEEAVEFAPKIAKYHMNLGIAYMRVGNTDKAGEEFRIAAELDPGDFHAMLFGYVIPGETPPQITPIDLQKLKNEDNIHIQDLRDLGAADDELPTPWDACTPCEKARKIPELLAERDSRIFNQFAQSYADELGELAKSVIEGLAPKLKSAAEDLNSWWAIFKWSQTTYTPLVHNAEIALGNKWTSMTRQRGREIIGYSSFFRECVLEQAKIDGQTRSDYEEDKLKDIPRTAGGILQERAENYQIALEEAFSECYKDPMLTAAALLTEKNSPYGLPEPQVEVIPWIYFPLLLPDLCLTIDGYCDGEPDLPEYSESMFNNTLSLNLLIVSFEYNYDTEAWELRVAPETGIILGATWSPESGYGYQAGVDLGLDLKVVGFDLQCYFEVDKTGMHIKGETGAFVNLGILEAGIERSISQTLIPFQAVPGEATPLSETE